MPVLLLRGAPRLRCPTFCNAAPLQDACAAQALSPAPGPSPGWPAAPAAAVAMTSQATECSGAQCAPQRAAEGRRQGDPHRVTSTHS